MGATFSWNADGVNELLSEAARECCLPAAENIAAACTNGDATYGARLLEGTHRQPTYAVVRTVNWAAVRDNAANNTLLKNLGAGAL